MLLYFPFGPCTGPSPSPVQCEFTMRPTWSGGLSTASGWGPVLHLDARRLRRYCGIVLRVGVYGWIIVTWFSPTATWWAYSCFITHCGFVTLTTWKWHHDIISQAGSGRQQWHIQDIPEVGGANPWVWAKKPITWQDFCWKLHENEKNGPWCARDAWIRQWSVTKGLKISINLCSLK